MTALIWIGTLVTLAGIAGIVWVMAQAIGIKRADLPPDETRVALERLSPWNMAALGVSSMGMMLVVAGIILR